MMLDNQICYYKRVSFDFLKSNYYDRYVSCALFTHAARKSLNFLRESITSKVQRLSGGTSTFKISWSNQMYVHEYKICLNFLPLILRILSRDLCETPSKIYILIKVSKSFLVSANREGLHSVTAEFEAKMI